MKWKYEFYIGNLAIKCVDSMSSNGIVTSCYVHQL